MFKENLLITKQPRFILAEKVFNFVSWTLAVVSLFLPFIVFLAVTGLHSFAHAQQNTRIIQTDSLGNKQYHKQQYKIVDNKICPVDSIGNVEYHKGCMVIEKQLAETLKSKEKK